MVGEQKLSLFRPVYPNYAAVARPADEAGQCRLDWHESTDDLRYGGRWERIRHEFSGDGIFALMPPALVSDKFVERLPNDRFDTWLSLLREFSDSNDDLVRRASVLVEYALSGNFLPDARLALETITKEEIGGCNDPSTLFTAGAATCPTATTLSSARPAIHSERSEIFESPVGRGRIPIRY